MGMDASANIFFGYCVQEDDAPKTLKLVSEYALEDEDILTEWSDEFFETDVFKKYIELEQNDEGWIIPLEYDPENYFDYGDEEYQELITEWLEETIEKFKPILEKYGISVEKNGFESYSYYSLSVKNYGLYFDEDSSGDKIDSDKLIVSREDMIVWRKRVMDAMNELGMPVKEDDIGFYSVAWYS